MDKIEELEKLVAEAKKEAEKFYTKKVKASGPRLRKHLMEIKNLCHDFRSHVTETKDSLKD